MIYYEDWGLLRWSASHDCTTKIFDDDGYITEDFDIASNNKPDDYGFIMVEECESKMLDDFDRLLADNTDLQKALNKIEKLAKKLALDNND